jgi:dCMP deaminase
MCDTSPHSNPAWDKRFLALAQTIASWSKDDSRKVGAVIVGKNNQVLSTGFNGLPRELVEKPVRTKRGPEGQKYLWTEHAERNSIYNAAYSGVAIRDAAMYVTLFPCADCARAIIQAGISRLICISHERSESDPFSESWAVATEMLLEAGVQVEFVDLD